MTYYRHATTDDATLLLMLRSSLTGAGVTGATPEVAIRRVRESQGGSALDGLYYDGLGGFTNTPTWLVMAEFDPAQQPGVYSYVFAQSAIGASHIYVVTYRNTTAPAVGSAAEEHIFTDEISIPVSVPVVPVSPSDSVMGRLAAMEDPNGIVAQANADAIWDEPINNHLGAGTTGAALAALAAGQTGSNTVAITIESTGSVPIPGAQVDVLINGNFLFRGHTNLLGELTVALDPGDYTVQIFAANYVFTVPENLTVAGNMAVTYQGQGLAVPTAPSAPNLCVIYGTLRDASGAPHDGICVEVFAVTPQASAVTVRTKRIASTFTDALGFFQLEIERLTRVTIQAEEANLESIKDVPDAPSQNLATWPDAIL